MKNTMMTLLPAFVVICHIGGCATDGDSAALGPEVLNQVVSSFTNTVTTSFALNCLGIQINLNKEIE